jgi:hypothetical protein
MEARLLFFLNFKGTPSQEEHRTIVRGLKICKMALLIQICFPAFFSHHKMTYCNFIKSGVRRKLMLV